MSDTVHRQSERDPFHYRHRGLFVGLFVLIPLIVIPLLLAITLFKTTFMGETDIVHVRCGHGAGLKKNLAVTFRGWKIGYVERVRLNDQGRFDMQLRVGRRYMRFLRADSKALIKQKNIMLGDYEVELTAGSVAASPMRNGDTLGARRPLMADELAEQAAAALASVQAIIADVESGRGLAGRLVMDDSLVADVKQLLSDSRGLLHGARGSLHRANAMFGEFQRAGVQGAAVLDSVQYFLADMKGLMGSVHSVAYGIDSLIQEIDTLPREVQALVRSLHRDAREADVLLRGMQKHWLLRRSVRKAKEEDGAGDSR